MSSATQNSRQYTKSATCPLLAPRNAVPRRIVKVDGNKPAEKGPPNNWAG